MATNSTVYTSIMNSLDQLLIGPTGSYTTVAGDSLTGLSTRFYQTTTLATALGRYNLIDGRKASNLPAGLAILIPHGSSTGTAEQALLDSQYQQIALAVRFARAVMAQANTYNREGLQALSDILFAAAKGLDYMLDTQGSTVDRVDRLANMAGTIRRAASWLKVNAPYGQENDAGNRPTITDVANTNLLLLKGWVAWRDSPAFDVPSVLLAMLRGVSA